MVFASDVDAALEEAGLGECHHIHKTLDMEVVQTLCGGGDREANLCIVSPPQKRRRFSHAIAHSALHFEDKLNGSSSNDVLVDGVLTLPPHATSGQGLFDSASVSEPQSREDTRVFEMYSGAALVDGQQRTLQGKAKTKCCLETSPSEFWHEASTAHEVYHAGFGASMEHEQFCCTGPSDWTGLFS